MAIYFKESDWITVRRCAEAECVAVVTLGSLEQHGPHLPCGMDSIQIDEIMARTADPARPEAAGLHMPYCGLQRRPVGLAVSVAPKTMQQCLVDICHALTDLSFSKIVLAHGHGGLPAGRSALWQAMHEKRPALYVDLMTFERCQVQFAEIVGGPTGHSGATETSMIMAIRPDLVNVRRAGPTPASL